MRDLILQGIIPMPTAVTEVINPDYHQLAHKTWKSLVKVFLMKKGTTSTPYWLDKWGNSKEFNKFLMVTSMTGWVTSTVQPNRNWAEMGINQDKLLNLVSKKELKNIRRNYKHTHYTLGSDTEIAPANRTRLSSGIKDTGLVREGFASAGTSEFGFDTTMMNKYMDSIAIETLKEIESTRAKHDGFNDDVDYALVVNDALAAYVDHPWNVYTLGANVNDSRGRAVFNALSKVFNPISNKFARALVTCPAAPLKSLESVFLFIAEIHSVRPSTKYGKMRAGKTLYAHRAYTTAYAKVNELKRTNTLLADSFYHLNGVRLDATNFKAIRKAVGEYRRGSGVIVKAIHKNNKKIKELSNSKGFDNHEHLHEDIWLERLYNAIDQWYNTPNMAWDIPIEVDGTALTNIGAV